MRFFFFLRVVSYATRMWKEESWKKIKFQKINPNPSSNLPSMMTSVRHHSSSSSSLPLWCWRLQIHHGAAVDPPRTSTPLPLGPPVMTLPTTMPVVVDLPVARPAEDPLIVVLPGSRFVEVPHSGGSRCGVTIGPPRASTPSLPGPPLSPLPTPWCRRHRIYPLRCCSAVDLLLRRPGGVSLRLPISRGEK